MTSKRVVLSFGLLATFSLADAATSSADVSAAREATIVAGDPCLFGPADQTKALGAGKASVSIAQPNVTPVPGAPPPPSRACKSSYISDFTISPASVPPVGFTDHFRVLTTWQSGAGIDKKECLATHPDVRIYRKSDAGLAWVGGGVLVSTFLPATAPTPATGPTPASCSFAEPPDFTNVTGRLPFVNTETYRVLVSFAGVGSSVSTVARVAK